jgi:hypothetical protein
VARKNPAVEAPPDDVLSNGKPAAPEWVDPDPIDPEWVLARFDLTKVGLNLDAYLDPQIGGAYSAMMRIYNSLDERTRRGVEDLIWQLWFWRHIDVLRRAENKRRSRPANAHINDMCVYWHEVEKWSHRKIAQLITERTGKPCTEDSAGKRYRRAKARRGKDRK